MTQTVYAVDDNSDELRILQRVVSKARCDISLISFHNAETALKSLEESAPPAMVFLDLKLPGMSGIDALRELRTKSRFDGVPVIVLSNSSLEADKRDALSAGATEFLHKASDLNQFTADIRRLLECWISR